MAFKIVGADENSDFPTRVETRLAEKFAPIDTPGIKGDKGDPGTNATITGATATGLAAGAEPTVTVGGTASARSFVFGIPAGAKGAKGDQGEPGADGESSLREDANDPGFFIF